MHSRITRNFAFLAVVLLLLVLFQARVPRGQATWTVDDDGPADFQTIQEAVNAAVVLPGDTIEVSAGVYYENVYVEKSLTFRGQNKYNTIVDGNGTGHAFWLVESNVNISGFTIRNGYKCGIQADSGGHFFTDNILLSNSYGIYLHITLSGSIVVNNTFHSNNQVGIKVYSSGNNNISNNYISHSTYGVKLDQTSEYNSIVNNTISKTSHGIHVGYSSNNNIDRNNVSSKTTGIYSLYSDHINIRNNTVSECAFGIELYGTSNNTVSGNTMVQNGYGVYLVYAGNNIVDSNLVSNNYWGIATYDSGSNNVTQNTFSYNTYCGIYLTYYSTENTIALNNIIENEEQMFRDTTSKTNTWNTKISGKDYGNYWSDYEGEDTEPENGDGVGDTLTPHQFVDDYPLMQPWSIVHDVATLSVTPSKDTVYQGQMVNITVVVRNEGTTNETFNVTAKYFNRIIETKTVTNLGLCESTTIVFSWNTTGVPIDFDYEISAEALPVAGETDIADNIFVDGTITVEKPRIPGDVNGDGIVDASDLFYLSKAYGSELGDVNWNMSCDFNMDNKVDFSDLSDLNKNYGKTA